LFFVSEKTILECKEKVEKFKMREEAVKQIKSEGVMLKESEIKDIS
jgi:hypothetical protein